jgi:Fe2+ transport system protein FeoA
MKRHGSARHEKTLNALKEGESGIVSSVNVKHGKGRLFEKRLMDIGLTPGTKVRVVKAAPFHGPIEICFRGSRIALGRGMAERIFVELEK